MQAKILEGVVVVTTCPYYYTVMMTDRLLGLKGSKSMFSQEYIIVRISLLVLLKQYPGMLYVYHALS